MSEKTWQRLSESDRAAVTKAGREVADWIRKEIRANDERLLKDMESKGAKIASEPRAVPGCRAAGVREAKEKYGADVDAVLADAAAVRKGGM